MSVKIKKYLFYTRYILILLFIVYLILIWMYFKDNVSSISSTDLLNGFVVIPLFILTSIMLVHWQYKKKDKLSESDEQSPIASDTTPNQPVSYEVLIHSYVCLPEGEHFIDIIESSDDLTVLSPDYTSFDNLPILIKPIAQIDYDTDELYLHEDDIDSIDIDSITHRICSIIRHLLTQNETALIEAASQFVSKSDTTLDKSQQNLTLSMHPKWQQSHILSENNEAQSTLNSQPSDTKLSNLPIYLLIPDLVNKSYIKQFLIEQLIGYGFAEDVIDIHSVQVESPDNTSTPLGVIKNHIKNLANSADPQLSLVIGVDSQINDEWLEAYYYTSANPSSIVPEEAGVMLFVCNTAAKSFVEIDKYTATSLIEFSTQGASNISAVQTPSNTTDYASNIRSISNYLQHNLLTNSESDQEDNDTLPLAPFSLTLLSDISPLSKPYNMTVFMRLIDDLNHKGARVDEHHLGRDSASNEWMTQLISLSLYADIETKEDDKFNKTLLITHDKTDTLLWITTTTVTI